jgi:hypothetical protein
MITDVNRYILQAAAVLRANMIPVLIPVVVGLLFYLPKDPEKNPGALFFLPVFLLFVLYPLVYGQYIEIVTHNRPAAYPDIFRAHWFNYFIVSVVIGVPALMMSFLGIYAEAKTGAFKNITSISVDIITIYVIPLVFLMKKRLKCIPLGVKCLVGNFQFSMPLIALSLIPSILALMIRPLSAGSEYTFGTMVFGYLFWVASIYVDCLVFVSAALILRDKLLIENG